MSLSLGLMEVAHKAISANFSIAKQVAATRFGPKKKTQKDMLGSFVARGLTQAEAESEILMQL